MLNNANTGAANMTAQTFGVYYRIDFDMDNRDARGRPGFKMGRGAAGYTTAYFASETEAQKFADNMPAVSRMPNHGVWAVR